MAKIGLNQLIKRRVICHQLFSIFRTDSRKILSAAYTCDDAWQQRLESPFLKDIKLKQYFIELDKKFGTKRLASGVDVDLFVNSAADESLLEEMEHILFRFRKTKRAIEIHGSTPYATIRAFMKYKRYDALFRILSDRMNYGIFPDFYCYNMMMNTFLKENRYRDAAEVAVLMMQQEDFENPISCILGLYSCHMFVKEGSFETWERNPKPPPEEDDGEEVFIRVPFLKTPWFDDHFEIVNPKHLIGKSFYLIGKEVKDVLGNTCQLIGLGMYEKWEKASKLLDVVLSDSKKSVFLKEGVEKFKVMLLELPDDEDKTKEKWLSIFTPKFEMLEAHEKFVTGDIHSVFQKKLEEIPKLEEADIKAQKSLFLDWEKARAEAVAEQEKSIDKERRIKVIEEKKEYLYWKEKFLYFYENEEKILDELEEVKKIEDSVTVQSTKEEIYEPPEITKKAHPQSVKLKLIKSDKHFQKPRDHQEGISSIY